MNDEVNRIIKTAINTQARIASVEQMARHIAKLEEIAKARQALLTERGVESYWSQTPSMLHRTGLQTIVRIFDVSDLYEGTDTVDRTAIAQELDQVMPHETRELFKNTGIIIQFIEDK